MSKNNEEEREVIEEEEEETIWLKHYSSLHHILLVGEGDFSFSLALSNAFGSAHNIVATSLDSFDELTAKYAKAKSNLGLLSEAGATVLHGVDATRMKLHTDLKMRKFDRIVFNFPHAGFRGKEDQLKVINLHRSLLMGFFRNASHMLRPSGEVHVSHKVEDPYRKWDLEGLASKNGLVLFECNDFSVNDYPGYANKRGEGKNSDHPFRLGECCTFKFRIGENPKRKMRKENKLPSVQAAFQAKTQAKTNYYSYCNGKENVPFMENKLPWVVPATFQASSEVNTNYQNVYSHCNNNVNTPFFADLARCRSLESLNYFEGVRPCGEWNYPGSCRSGYELCHRYREPVKCGDEQLIEYHQSSGYRQHLEDKAVVWRVLISLHGKA